MEYDYKTLKKYKLKQFKNYKKPETRDEKRRNVLIRCHSENTKLHEKRYLLNEINKIMECSKQPDTFSFQQHTRPPYSEVVEFLQKRIDELNIELKDVPFPVRIVVDQPKTPDTPDKPTKQNPFKGDNLRNN